MWDVGYRHVEYVCKLVLRSYVDSLWVDAIIALLNVMFIMLVIFAVGKDKEKEGQWA